MKWSVVLCFCALFLHCTDAANIVVFMPIAFYSHQTAFKPLWLELAKRGHQITLIQSDVIVQNNENITHIPLHGTYDLMERFKVYDQLGEGKSIVSILFSGVQTFSDILVYQLGHPGVQELVRSEKKVDLFFTEYLCTYGFALGRKLGAPIIGVVSMDGPIHSHLAVGNPTHALIYPDKDMSFSSEITFKDRLMGSLFWLSFNIVVKYLAIPMQERMSEQYLGVTASTEEIVRDNMSLLFINSNPLFDIVRPLGPKTVNIGGGVHILEPRPLPKKPGRAEANKPHELYRVFQNLVQIF